MSELTHEELTRLLDYDPETGVFRWKVDRRGGVGGIKAGDVAGSKENSGNRIRINGKSYYSRYLVWFYFHKEFPRNNLFVKNGDQFDDRIENIGMLPDKPKELTHEYLKECIDYNPKTGDFKWKIGHGGCSYGEEAFCISNVGNNYIILRTRISGKLHSTLRLIVFWMTGYMPSEKRVVMPIDNNVLNLKWSNIKVGGRAKVRIKARTYGNCATKGVSFSKKAKKYQAFITVNGKKKYLGFFPTEAKAHAAYMKAARKYYGELANDGYQHAMYEMEYEGVEQPFVSDLDEDIQVAVQEVDAILDGKIEPVIHHADDF